MNTFTKSKIKFAEIQILEEFFNGLHTRLIK
jgi:hypothetical protein